MPSSYTPYSLPDAANSAQRLRDLQMRSSSGLAGLMGPDDTAERAKYEQALYNASAEGINTAADRAREKLVEGTFAKGVGPSSISVELLGRGQQEHADALARAARDAYTGAGEEMRLNRASLSDLYNSGLSGATTGLQGEANVGLGNAELQQKGNMFYDDLEFQRSENASDRALKGSQFDRDLQLQYDQLSAQEKENLARRQWTSGESALDRELSRYLQSDKQEFTRGESALDRALSRDLQDDKQSWTSSESALDRLLSRDLQTDRQNFTRGESALDRDLSRYLQDSRLDWTAGESALDRALSQDLQTDRQTWTGGQNQLSLDAQMERLLLQLANDRDIADSRNLAGGLALGGTGLGGLIGPWLSDFLRRS